MEQIRTLEKGIEEREAKEKAKLEQNKPVRTEKRRKKETSITSNLNEIKRSMKTFKQVS